MIYYPGGGPRDKKARHACWKSLYYALSDVCSIFTNGPMGSVCLILIARLLTLRPKEGPDRVLLGYVAASPSEGEHTRLSAATLTDLGRQRKEPSVCCIGFE